MKDKSLKALGFTRYFDDQAREFPELFIGRIASQSKDIYKVVGESGVFYATIAGKFRFNTNEAIEYPVVGDFVAVNNNTNHNGNAIIHHVLSRKSVLTRKAAGNTRQIQALASNIDTIFICMALNNDFNLRRLERYLSVAWESGATPVIVLTKSDLTDSIEEKTTQVNSVAIGVEVLVTTIINNNDYQAILPYIKAYQTVAFIGSSGVGKTSLINQLVGEKSFETKGLRNDDKGRHTTTSRELIILDNNAIVIDTPGIRELGVDNGDFSKTFNDIELLSQSCKFNDCQHQNEPNCAVKYAITVGELSEERLLNFHKLKKEACYDGLNSRQIESLKTHEMFKSFGGAKNVRKALKQKNKRY